MSGVDAVMATNKLRKRSRLRSFFSGKSLKRRKKLPGGAQSESSAEESASESELLSSSSAAAAAAGSGSAISQLARAARTAQASDVDTLGRGPDQPDQGEEEGGGAGAAHSGTGDADSESAGQEEGRRARGRRRGGVIIAETAAVASPSGRKVEMREVTDSRFLLEQRNAQVRLAQEKADAEAEEAKEKEAQMV